MKVKYKSAVAVKEFNYQQGDEVKIISTSFLYATKNQPERIYTAKITEVEEDGFWAIISTMITHPYSDTARMPGVTEEITGEREEFFSFGEIEDVLDINMEYPDRQDPLVRFALDGRPSGNSRQPGRPSLGVTKKVSLTLPEDTWEWFDAEAEKLVGSRSALLRYLIGREQSPESRWSNNACLGYAILGAQKLGYSEEQLQKLVRAIYREFDFKSVEEARGVYERSPY